jgi:hypothetical protein
VLVHECGSIEGEIEKYDQVSSIMMMIMMMMIMTRVDFKKMVMMM